jgi:hypothetical protein
MSTDRRRIDGRPTVVERHTDDFPADNEVACRRGRRNLNGNAHTLLSIRDDTGGVGTVDHGEHRSSFDGGALRELDAYVVHVELRIGVVCCDLAPPGHGGQPGIGAHTEGDDE